MEVKACPVCSGNVQSHNPAWLLASEAAPECCLLVCRTDWHQPCCLCVGPECCHTEGNGLGTQVEGAGPCGRRE